MASPMLKLSWLPKMTPAKGLPNALPLGCDRKKVFVLSKDEAFQGRGTLQNGFVCRFRHLILIGRRNVHTPATKTGCDGARHVVIHVEGNAHDGRLMDRSVSVTGPSPRRARISSALSRLRRMSASISS